MRKNKYVIYLMAVIAVIAIVWYTDAQKDVKAAKVSSAIMNESVWSPIISENVNGNILLNIDGRQIELDDDDIFMDIDRNIYINCSIAPKLFMCAVNVYSDGKIIIQKFNTSLIVNIGSDDVYVDGFRYKLETPVIETDTNIYVPVSIFGDFLEYEYSWDYTNNTVLLTNNKMDEKIYPYKYDCRDYDRVTPTKNQADLGTCWAFASLTALETSLTPEKTYDFSEDHMSWNNGYNLLQNEGGDSSMAMAYLLSWKGPVLEREDPYGDGKTVENLTPSVHVQEIQVIGSKNFDGIKRAVFLEGGVQSSLYMSLRDAEGNSSNAYNADTSAYCYIGTEKANHDVVILGWDDTYAASNFSVPPEGDGAFICVNSWGETFGENGYFYVSYYDVNIGVHNVVYTLTEANDNYDNIYQSDLCGWIGQLGYNRESAYFANVYTAKSDEKLRAVGFYATGPDTEYEIYYVENFESSASLSGKVLVEKGSFSNKGFYTVELDNEILLNKGEKYAVIVHITTPGVEYPIAIECASNYATENVDITDGEGYISLYGSRWENVESTQKCNICLKTYTDDMEELE